tara:strand:- start:48 stop:860 length:813 start_codon:yes stop_codon:yes gene_type:complete
MVEQSDTSEQQSLKSKWENLTERGILLTKGVGTSIVDVTKQLSDASKQAASQAKDSIAERRQKKIMDKMAKDVDALLAEDKENIDINSDDVKLMRRRIATLEVRQKEQEHLIDEMSQFTDDLVSDFDQTPVTNVPSENIGFVATLRQTYSLIGFAVIWAFGLSLMSKYSLQKNQTIFDYPLEPFIWILGAMIWGYVVISQLSRVGSFEKLPLSFRLQATIGVGAATSVATLLPAIQDTPAMFIIFSWLVIAAVTVLTLSAITNGLSKSKN